MDTESDSGGVGASIDSNAVEASGDPIFVETRSDPIPVESINFVQQLVSVVSDLSESIHVEAVVDAGNQQNEEHAPETNVDEGQEQNEEHAPETNVDEGQQQNEEHLAEKQSVKKRKEKAAVISPRKSPRFQTSVIEHNEGVVPVKKIKFKMVCRKKKYVPQLNEEDDCSGDDVLSPRADSENVSEGGGKEKVVEKEVVEKEIVGKETVIEKEVESSKRRSSTRLSGEKEKETTSLKIVEKKTGNQSGKKKESTKDKVVYKKNEKAAIVKFKNKDVGSSKKMVVKRKVESGDDNNAKKKLKVKVEDGADDR